MTVDEARRTIDPPVAPRMSTRYYNPAVQARREQSWYRQLFAARMRTGYQDFLRSERQYGKWTIQTEGYIREVDGYLNAALSFHIINGETFLKIGSWVSSWRNR